MSVGKGNLLKTYPAKMIIMHGKSEYVMTKEYGSFQLAALLAYFLENTGWVLFTK